MLLLHLFEQNLFELFYLGKWKRKEIIIKQGNKCLGSTSLESLPPRLVLWKEDEIWKISLGC